ncbi:hypothetical protein BDB00DRAFT_792993 [Zychaea mexicana]|uniref:uncharacterized protein n=1 Tax=Zychaea mexicana TaxID=64656 RepID=UPI0022FE689D|nr:uncharacterized protein BDB00DRAFT_792993 [Zychaea mexicana]KAI9482617.1 hypothetical protein BDB00DRAFT_792993 [Zychaea mexicana]
MFMLQISFARLPQNLDAEDTAFQMDMVSNPPTTTTTNRLSSADAFDIDDFVLLSTQIVNATGAEPLPPSALPDKLRPYVLPAVLYDALIEYYGNAYGDQGVQFAGYVEAEDGLVVVRPNVAMFSLV